MASIVMELTERNLAKHDERLAEIREKRMIDPNSEKFYRIWSWIRDVNEQIANTGHLTTPQHSRPATARQRGADGQHNSNNNNSNVVRQQAKRSSADLEDDFNQPFQPDDGDDVEDLMGDDNNNTRVNNNRSIPLALLNVTTDPTTAKPALAEITYIDDDVRAVDDDEYDPRRGVIGRQHTWANFAAANNSGRATPYNATTPRQQLNVAQQQQPAFNNRSQLTTPAYAAYGPTPSGKIVFVKPAAAAAAAAVAVDTSNLNKQQQTGFKKLSNNVDNNNANAIANAMTPGAFYTAVSRAAQRAAVEGRSVQIANHVAASTAPAAVGRQGGATAPGATLITPSGGFPSQSERLRSGLSSRRTAPATIIPVATTQSQQQQQQQQQQQGVSQVILKLQVSGEQLRPRAIHTLHESRSQASLVSSDPSGGTSKLSLPLMDRIKRLTSKIKPQLKHAFGSNNAVAPSIHTTSNNSNPNLNMSMDSLAMRQDSSLFGDDDNNNNNQLSGSNPNLMATKPLPTPHHVRFVGVPPLDDDDTSAGGNVPTAATRATIIKNRGNGTIIKTTPPSDNHSSNDYNNNNNKQGGIVTTKRFLQQTAQRIYRPFVQQAGRGQPPGRPQDSPAALQVTLV